MSLPLLETEKWIFREMGAEIRTQMKFLKHAETNLAEFATSATAIEQEQRELLASMPAVGTVTIDVVLRELGDDPIGLACGASEYALEVSLRAAQETARCEDLALDPATDFPALSNTAAHRR